MELTNAANEFVGSPIFSLIVLGVILIMAVFLRLVFGPAERGY